MRTRRGLRALTLALLFLILGGCLLLAERQIRLSGGETALTAAELPGGNAALYLPRAVPVAEALPAHDDEGDDGHRHEAVYTGGKMNAVMILSRGADGASVLAAELSRRGVAALIVNGENGREAWDWLTAQDFVRLSGTALAAPKGRSAEALDLADSLRGTGRECAAVILLGDAGTLRRAGGSDARNVLMFTGRADPAAEEAFFGSAVDAERGFSGYFSDGSARACVRGGGSFFSRRTLETVMDWQGSSLGHTVELPDDDLICGKLLLCRAWAGLCLLAAAGVLLCRRRIEEER